MENKIEDIPKTMEEFFGCSGKMVKPSTETVKALVQLIHKGDLTTIDLIREKIADDFKVKVTCPASISKALKLLSNESNPICYWRILKRKGELISQFPNGLEGHASLLEDEGFEIDKSKKKPVVLSYETNLFNFT
jgi:hypothetical protein